jgi:TetR/AcrR family transcriptional repressor of nem operon
MPPQSRNKEETRERMRIAASRSFRAHGFAGIGVDGIAKEAGVTSGAFYAHFGSKDGAFTAALEVGLDEVIAAIPQLQKRTGSNWLQALTDYYLGPDHRKDLAAGCAMTTLSPEVVRAGPETHATYEAKMTTIVALIAEGLESGTEEERHARAWAMIGTLIGGLTLARAVGSEDVAEQIATAARDAAVKIAGKPRVDF